RAVHPAPREGSPSRTSQARWFPGGIGVRRPERNRSDRDQLLADEGERGRLQPFRLSGSAEDAEQGRRGNSSASDVRGLQLDDPEDLRSSVVSTGSSEGGQRRPLFFARM